LTCFALGVVDFAVCGVGVAEGIVVVVWLKTNNGATIKTKAIVIIFFVFTLIFNYDLFDFNIVLFKIKNF
jgi:hypothetical protein